MSARVAFVVFMFMAGDHGKPGTFLIWGTREAAGKVSMNNGNQVVHTVHGAHTNQHCKTPAGQASSTLPTGNHCCGCSSSHGLAATASGPG